MNEIENAIRTTIDGLPQELPQEVKEQPTKTELDFQEAQGDYAAAEKDYNDAKEAVMNFDRDAVEQYYMAQGNGKGAAAVRANDQLRKLTRDMRDAKKVMEKKEKDLIAAKKTFDAEMKRMEEATTIARMEQERRDALIEKGFPEEMVMQMNLSDRGAIIHCPKNILLFLTYDEKYGGKFVLNEFTDLIEWDGKPLEDKFVWSLRYDINDLLGFSDLDNLNQALYKLTENITYHPIKEVLDVLQWDGKKRVETFFIDRLGAPDEAYVREITAKWFYAMVERIYNAGCTFDHVLVISDQQGGTGKTKTFQRLTEALNCSVSHPLTNTITDITNQQNNVLMLQRSVIGLFDESEGMKYANLERFKTFVSEKNFTARLPYAKELTNMPLHSVFAVTTNDSEFLTDNTSNFERRAWVMRCNGFPNRDRMWWEQWNSDEILQQVWAEVMEWRRNPQSAPYDMQNTHYNEISDDTKNALMEVQQQSKTYNANTVLMSTIENILLSYYSIDFFANQKEFELDFNKRTYDTTPDDYDIPLTCIPKGWLVPTVIKTMGKNISTETVVAAINQKMKELGDENGYMWVEKKHKRYNSQRLDCWERVTPPDNTGDLLKVEPQPKTTQKPEEKPKSNTLPDFFASVTEIPQ